MVPIHNKSPFAAQVMSFTDPDGQEVLLLVISATFTCDEAQRVAAAYPQPPVRVADEHYGDPANSSVRFEADVALEKPLVDVIVNGFAHAPAGQMVTSIPVELHVGDIHKRLIVWGDRTRRRSGAPSAPQPFVRMPIVYERAFGGYDRRDKDEAKHAVYPQNPVGVGFRDAPPVDPSITSELPNVEYTDGPVLSLNGAPAGFGAIGRGWSPRLQLAGTFDGAWLRDQWPLLPRDFQVGHYQAAPVDQQSGDIRGGEPIVLLNMTADGEWRTRVPILDVPVRLYFHDRIELATPRLDTVVLQPETRSMRLSLRLRIPVRRDRRALREILVGHASAAWLRAQECGKRYLDFGGTGGVNRSQAAWQ